MTRNISGTALPAFDLFRAGDVEPAIRELLQRSRGEVATLEAQPHPTFENTVLPLEQLSHRLSRTWSPISHLNGVLNSDELRASYNACLPLLSNYWTDLAQSESLYRAYSTIAANQSGSLDTHSVACWNARSRISVWPASGCPRSARSATRQSSRSWRCSARNSRRTCSIAMNAWTRHVTDASELSGINPVIVDQARTRAAEKGMEGWLFALEQPTYVAVMTDADSERLRRDFYEAWSTRASDRGPAAGKFDNTEVMQRRSSLCGTSRRGCSNSQTTPPMHSRRAWRPPPRPCSIS